MGVTHLTQQQLADRWHLSARTLEKWRWIGEGPPYHRIGGRVTCTLSDIEAFEAANRRLGRGRPGSRRHG